MILVRTKAKQVRATKSVRMSFGRNTYISGPKQVRKNETKRQAHNNFLPGMRTGAL
jgi:hypothetical protein